MAYAFSNKMKIINFGWLSRSVTTSTVGQTLATAGIIVVKSGDTKWHETMNIISCPRFFRQTASGNTGLTMVTTHKWRHVGYLGYLYEDYICTSLQ